MVGGAEGAPQGSAGGALLAHSTRSLVLQGPSRQRQPWVFALARDALIMEALLKRMWWRRRRRQKTPKERDARERGSKSKVTQPPLGMPPQPQAQTISDSARVAAPPPAGPTQNIVAGARPPVPPRVRPSLDLGAASSFSKPIKRSGGYWTQRGLPGFTLSVPQARIKHPLQPSLEA